MIVGRLCSNGKLDNGATAACGSPGFGTLGTTIIDYSTAKDDIAWGIDQESAGDFRILVGGESCAGTCVGATISDFAGARLAANGTSPGTFTHSEKQRDVARSAKWQFSEDSLKNEMVLARYSKDAGVNAFFSEARFDDDLGLDTSFRSNWTSTGDDIGYATWVQVNDQRIMTAGFHTSGSKGFGAIRICREPATQTIAKFPPRVRGAVRRKAAAVTRPALTDFRRSTARFWRRPI
jgi:hypothetical protein